MMGKTKIAKVPRFETELKPNATRSKTRAKLQNTAAAKPLKLSKLTRADRAALLRKKILSAAVKVIGEFGYQKASIGRIALAAGVAQGTVYLYFDARQDLFDEVLPHAGHDMMDFIGARLHGVKDYVDLEERGIRAFFEYLKLHPGFYRILNEAEFAAPTGHQRHFQLLVDHYVASMQRSIDEGYLRRFDEKELRAIAYTMMASRSYLYLAYVKYGGMEVPPDYVIDTYLKLIRSSCQPAKPVRAV